MKSSRRAKAVRHPELGYLDGKRAPHPPNALIQEVVRAYLHGWYPEIVTGLPIIEDGEVQAPQGPGLGIELRPEVWERSDAVVRESAL